MGTVIVIYAALVSTAALAWNVYSWIRAHRTQLRVDISNAIMGLPTGTMHVLSVQATNRGQTAAHVTSFGLEANDGSGRQIVFVDPVPGSTLPGPIPAHDSASGFQPIATLRPEDVDLTRPVVAFVVTAENERYRSKPATLLAA